MDIHILSYLDRFLLIANTQHRVLTGEDQKIERYNERLVKSLDAVVKAEKAVSAKEQELLEESRPEKRQKLEGELQRKRKTEERARTTLEKQRMERSSLRKGSGKVRLLTGMVTD